MATLQLPATNLANLANLPPGTKLYLTTNSKNPSGKGKLLLIPQGAILRATNNASELLIKAFGSCVSTRGSPILHFKKPLGGVGAVRNSGIYAQVDSQHTHNLISS